MHGTLENDRVGNTWVTQRVHCFFISGGMWTGPRMGNQPCKLKLTPLARQDSAGDIVYAGDDDFVVRGLGDDYIEGGAAAPDDGNVTLYGGGILIAQAKGSAGIDPKQWPPTAGRDTRISSQNAIAVCRPSAANDSEWRFAA